MPQSLNGTVALKLVALKLHPMKCPVFSALRACEKLSEIFTRFVRTYHPLFWQAAPVSVTRTGQKKNYGEADENHDRNRFFVDPERPGIRGAAGVRSARPKAR